ncbi:MAG: hypothetical protein ACI3W8_05820 [Oscillospiraceae bacterium]
MGYGEYMRALLRPLGVYRLQAGNLNYSETEAIGTALDGASGEMDLTEKEGQLATAEQSLSRWARLFTHPPAAEDTEALRRAIAALLLIGEGSFTPEAINATISGCGISCVVEETDTYGTVRVSFPGTAGVPEDFARKKVIIEEIIPCHLAIEYAFLFMTWAICERKGYTWKRVEDEAHSWESFSVAVDV